MGVVYMPVSDFELLEKYKKVIENLKVANDLLSKKHPYDDVQVSLLGCICTLTAHELGVSISAQINVFNRLLLQVEDRITRSEGKVA